MFSFLRLMVGLVLPSQPVGTLSVPDGDRNRTRRWCQKPKQSVEDVTHSVGPFLNCTIEATLVDS